MTDGPARKINMEPNQSKEPLVSIILTCHNSERFLRKTLDSVYQQTYKNWELIAVDDGSTDSTPLILKEAVDKDQRIRVIRRETCGGRPAISKNAGLNQAKGDFISFLDHDDIFLSQKIEASLKALLENTDCIAAFHDLTYIDASGESSRRYLENFKEEASPYIQSRTGNIYICSEKFYIFQSLKYAALHTITCLIAAKRIPPGESINFNTEYAICDDTDLWIRLGIMGRMVYIDEVHAQYRIHGSNITSNTLKLNTDAVKYILNNKARLKNKISRCEMDIIDKRLSSSYAVLGWTLRCERKPLQAAHAYWQSFRTSPGWSPLISLLKAWFPVGKR